MPSKRLLTKILRWIIGRSYHILDNNFIKKITHLVVKSKAVSSIKINLEQENQ